MRPTSADPLERSRGRVVVAALGFAALFGAVLLRLLEVVLLRPRLTTEELQSYRGIAGWAVLQLPLTLANVLVVYAAYKIRCRHLTAYGYVEVAIGSLTALLVLNQIGGMVTPGITTLLVAQIAAIYVAVRGLDNVHKSLTGARRRRWDRFWFGPW